MNYQETLDWMFRQLPMYQNKGKVAYKADLSNIKKLTSYLGQPEKNIKTIHVAGTNGKGSVSHMLASVFQEAGYTTGLYTSPHLKDFRERIRINGVTISIEAVVNFIESHYEFIAKNSFSFFELTVGMAFDYFATSKVHIAIIETGLGGRLDSTNIIIPELSIITNIGFDHTQILGDTLEAIAGEKAGIIKPGVPVVIGRKTPETNPVFLCKAKENHSPIYFTETSKNNLYQTDLLGSYQRENLQTVNKAVEVLKEKGWNLPEQSISKGLSEVIKNTGLLGRWQILQKQPKVICDTGHNIDGITAIVNQLEKETFQELHIVFGVVKDKDLAQMLPLLPRKAIYYFVQPNLERALEATILQKKASECGLQGFSFKTVQEGYQYALQKAKKEDVLFIGGSTFVVAEVV
ncbi:bifunctional folylpolyglutamate synthase/dihydrofolate synthase [Aquimarina sp. ERC-38]|uniref:bifunctional folylpolyglutamate synthase/dihydrofolate synthase n=1 Tax=Aquimarina sp. ERC-38 TaxID=2949996 RepID=UPI0022484D41|nr:folylpolyglutamate synthase/dihydrofolate synthase family protein [Aquimarina sp. ERC-38]UZO82375.1 bifunctional folylpolyglutamate synthase/dihydrofolate synthase [Aquimarina sp. ERC-38]